MLFLTPSVEIQKTIKIPLKFKGQRLRSCRQSLVISGGIITCSLTHISPSNISLWSVFTVRRVMQRTVLLSQFCLSVCLSVRPSDACIVTKLNDALRIFWHHTKRQSLVFWHQRWFYRTLVSDAPFSVKYSPKMTHPLRRTPTSTDFRA